MDFYRGGIQGNHRYPPVRYLFFLKSVKNPFQQVVFCPAVNSDVNDMPGAKGFRKGPPFTTVFSDIDDGIKEPAVIDFYISPLFGKKTEYLFSLFPR
jgi:hypothetical protein